MQFKMKFLDSLFINNSKMNLKTIKHLLGYLACYFFT